MTKHTHPVIIRRPKSRLAMLTVVVIMSFAGSIFLYRSYAATPTAGYADLNDDGIVNLTDLSMLLSNWGKTTATTTKPTLPSQLLKLDAWYLTLPTGTDSAGTVKQPDLKNYTSSYFQLNDAADAVVFKAPVSGSTTSNSEHTRSELRETASDGTIPWGWNAAKGSHIMTATEAVQHLPGGSGKVAFAQIHGPDSTWYLILIASGNSDGTATLYVKDQTGKADGKVIDATYVLGTTFNLSFGVVDGKVSIAYNGSEKVTTTSSLADSYFKIGAYNQSDGDYGQVAVYAVTVTHR